MRRRVSGAQASGYALVALLATISIMLLALSAAVPSWRYLMKNDREEELIFRGGEIADGIARYQRRNGNALPSSLEVLVKGKYLRRQYKDPMTKDGRWRYVRPGEVLFGATNPFQGTRSGSTTTTTTTTTRPSAFSQTTTIMGGFQGVASTSTQKSLRLFNGRSRYDEWLFAPGQPRIIGKPIGLPTGIPGGSDRSRMPGTTPGTTQPVVPPGGATGLPGAAPGVLAPQLQPYVVPP
jgi:type II secretory pathway pseudopilin PulG